MVDLLNIIELVPEYLIIVSQLEPATNNIKIKVYDQKHFLMNPDPLINEAQIAQYSISQDRSYQTVSEIRDLYRGWTKIDRTQPLQLIGIHNQDPQTLIIQFSLGERYFVYQRSLALHTEVVYEELFGKKHNYRQRPLCNEDEEHLIASLRFIPKARKAISFYSYKVPSAHYIRRRL